MNKNSILTIMEMNHISQSNLAKFIGISRQAVSKWFASNEETINIQSKHIVKLSKKLNLKIQLFYEPLPILNDSKLTKIAETELLWDKIFPNLIRFVHALIRGNLNALARLVQVYGLYQSEKIIGSVVWEKFPEYKNKIHPAQRKQLENLWLLEKSLLKSQA